MLTACNKRLMEEWKNCIHRPKAPPEEIFYNSKTALNVRIGYNLIVNRFKRRQRANNTGLRGLHREKMLWEIQRDRFLRVSQYVECRLCGSNFFGRIGMLCGQIIYVKFKTFKFSKLHFCVPVVDVWRFIKKQRIRSCSKNTRCATNVRLLFMKLIFIGLVSVFCCRLLQSMFGEIQRL